MPIEAQCFGCLDDCSFQYHGAQYNAKKAAESYIAAYKEMGYPVILCYSCGSRVKYEQQENGKWLQKYVGVTE